MTTDTAISHQLTTRDGVVLDVRLAGEADEAALRVFFDAVSEQDRRFRFFAAGQHVSPDQLDPLIHADHFRSESYIAFDHATGELVASGLLACDGKLDTGEIAVSVRADYRGRGVGHAFFDHREAQARRCGADAACFAAVIRPADHPARPGDYRPLDSFWRARGYAPIPDFVTHLAWKEHGQAEESPKPLQYWLRTFG